MEVNKTFESVKGGKSLYQLSWETI